MILRICPYQILKNKQCSHFLKTILSILNWLISRVKIHNQRKFISFNLHVWKVLLFCLTLVQGTTESSST